MDSTLPDALLIDAAAEVVLRQDLVLIALGQAARRHGRCASGDCSTCTPAVGGEDQEIVIKGRRIAWVGPAGDISRARSRSASTAPAFRGARLRRGAQAHRELAPDAGMGGGAGAAARQYLDLRGQPRILQRQRPAQPRILARGAQARLAAEDFSAPRLGGAADRL